MGTGEELPSQNVGLQGADYLREGDYFGARADSTGVRFGQVGAAWRKRLGRGVYWHFGFGLYYQTLFWF